MIIIMDVIRCVLFVVSAFGVVRSEQTTGEEDKTRLCTEDTSGCIQPGESAICSGRGDCICGVCQCSTFRGDLPLTYSGQWCECDDFTCPFYNGVICGGSDHGRCNCGFCKCYRGFTGKDCGCSVKTDRCISQDGSICEGHGTCKCNECRCDEGYSGPQCIENQSIRLCDLNKDCVLCKTGLGDTEKNPKICSKACQHLRVSIVDQVQETPTNAKDIFCKYEDLKFAVETDENNHILIKVAKLQESSENNGIMMSGISLFFLVPCVAFINHLLQ